MRGGDDVGDARRVGKADFGDSIGQRRVGLGLGGKAVDGHLGLAAGHTLGGLDLGC